MRNHESARRNLDESDPLLVATATNEAQLAAAVEATLARFGRIDVVVNDAGHLLPPRASIDGPLGLAIVALGILVVLAPLAVPGLTQAM